MQTKAASSDAAQERLLQTLSGMLIELSALHTLVETEEAKRSLDFAALRDGLTTLEQMTREALAAVRSANEESLPAALEGVTLAEALSHLVETTAETLGLSSRVAFSGLDEQGTSQEHTLPQEAERLLYLIAQEALYQVEQHAGARKLRFALTYGSNDVQMSIEDDGLSSASRVVVSEEAGDDSPASPLDLMPAPAPSGVHDGSASAGPILTDLRSRIQLLGGSLELSDASGQGNSLVARVPYTKDVHETKETSSVSPKGQEITASPSSAEPVSMLIVDGHAVTRAGLQRLLESYPGLHVIGVAGDGVQAVSETLELGPQVVLMDAQLPHGQSLEALRQIKQLNLDTKVLLLSTLDREEYLYESLRAGADGYVLKDLAPDELAQAVRVVAQGEVLVQPQLAGRLLSRVGKQGRDGARHDTLTARELEVLRLLARGLRNKEISARLFVSERTVNFHLANIYQKLNVSGRTEALSKALEQGLLVP